MLIRTLAEAISHYGNDALSPHGSERWSTHASNVTVALNGSSIDCNLGGSAARNIARVPTVSLFWPPTEPGGYAFIVNGMAASKQRPTGAPTAEITHSRNRCCI